MLTLKVYLTLVGLKIHLFHNTWIRAPYKLLVIYFRHYVAIPIALGYKITKKGYKDTDKINKLMRRWNRYTTYCSNLELKRKRREYYKMACRIQEKLGTNINLL